MITHFRAVTVLVCLLAACAEASSEGNKSSPHTAAQTALSEALRFHTAVHTHYAEVKGELEADTYALYDALYAELWQQDDTPVWQLSDVRHELEAQVRPTSDENPKLAAQAAGGLFNFSAALTDPRSDKAPDELVRYLESSAESYWDIAAVLTSLDPAQRESAYLFAPLFNIIASTRIVVLATAGFPATDRDAVYAKTIEIDERLLDDDSVFSEYVASRYADGASARESDPIVQSLRRMLAEQQAALE